MVPVQAREGKKSLGIRLEIENLVAAKLRYEEEAGTVELLLRNLHFALPFRRRVCAILRLRG